MAFSVEGTTGRHPIYNLIVKQLRRVFTEVVTVDGASVRFSLIPGRALNLDIAQGPWYLKRGPDWKMFADASSIEEATQIVAAEEVGSKGYRIALSGLTTVVSGDHGNPVNQQLPIALQYRYPPDHREGSLQKVTLCLPGNLGRALARVHRDLEGYFPLVIGRSAIRPPRSASVITPAMLSRASDPNCTTALHLDASLLTDSDPLALLKTYGLAFSAHQGYLRLCFDPVQVKPPSYAGGKTVDSLRQQPFISTNIPLEIVR